VISFWIVPDWPETAKFLKPDEREVLIRRLAMDVEQANMNHWNKKTAKRVFSDVKIYLGLVNFCACASLNGRLTITASRCTWVL